MDVLGVYLNLAGLLGACLIESLSNWIALIGRFYNWTAPCLEGSLIRLLRLNSSLRNIHIKVKAKTFMFITSGVHSWKLEAFSLELICKKLNTIF